MKKLLTLIIVSGVCALAWASNQGASAILATVEGEVITLGDVLRESAAGEAAAKAYADKNITGEIAQLRHAAVERIIDRKLLVQEFNRLKLVLPQQYVENMLDDLAENLGCRSRTELAVKARSMNSSLDELRSKAAERLKAEMVIGRQLYAAAAPTPQELDEYFRKHEEEFSRPEQVRLALLLLPEKSSEATVTQLRTQLQKEPGRFAELVKAFSCGPNREQGGDVGIIERKNLRSEFAEALADKTLQPDAVYGPLKTAEGIYFIRIVSYNAGKKAEFAEVREAIRQRLELQSREKCIGDLKKKLRSRASIVYYYGRTADSTAVAAENDKNAVKNNNQPQQTDIKTEKKKMVTLKTNHGDIKLELFADAAPKTVENFLEYVKSGFYNGTLFHRVIDGFMIQGGGFDQNFKQKKTREPIENEADNRLSNEIGTIAMARTMDPHSATAQFFINVANNDFLDFRSPSPQFYGYCVFGKVVEGMDVVNKIKVVKTGGRAGHQDVPKEDVVILEAVID